MKKFLVFLIICIIAVSAYAWNFNTTLSCSGNDGQSYVQGQVERRNVTDYIVLNGYGKYKDATARVIVYVRSYDGKVKEYDRKTVNIKNGYGECSLNLNDNVTDIKIEVANFCN